MNLNISKKSVSIAKAIVSFSAILSILTSVAMPEQAQAKGFLAMFSRFIDGESVLAEDQAPGEVVAFPESDTRPARKTITVVSTAYNSLGAQTDDTPCIPASGYDLCKHYEKYGSYDTIAANFLPLGTQVRFPDLYGDKVFIVRDRMNARYGYGRIDIWLPEKAEAKVFGVKRLTMEVL